MNDSLVNETSLTVSEGLQLIKEASCILERISNQPGVTSTEFRLALDADGIFCSERRDALFLAASNIEMSLEQISDNTQPTIH